MGFGEAQVFSEQMNKIDWKKSSHEDKLLYLEKLYQIVKGTNTSQKKNLENLGTDGIDSLDPLLNADSLPLATMEAVELQKNETTIDMQKNEI